MYSNDSIILFEDNSLKVPVRNQKGGLSNSVYFTFGDKYYKNIGNNYFDIDTPRRGSYHTPPYSSHPSSPSRTNAVVRVPRTT